MNLTDAEKRAAFYKAADVIEQNPELYSFWRITVGETDCPACMWGHVGRVLRFDENSAVHRVAALLGFNGSDVLYLSGGFDHKETNGKFTGSGVDSAIPAAKRLRAFADHHWPAKDIIHHKPSAMSFKELIDSLSVAA